MLLGLLISVINFLINRYVKDLEVVTIVSTSCCSVALFGRTDHLSVRVTYLVTVSDYTTDHSVEPCLIADARFT